MEEQLPLTLSEIVAFQLYLSSFTLLIGLIGLFILKKLKKQFSWKSFLINAFVFIISTVALYFIVWQIWPFEFDMMYGPLHIPTFIILLIVLTFNAIN